MRSWGIFFGVLSEPDHKLQTILPSNILGVYLEAGAMASKFNKL